METLRNPKADIFKELNPVNLGINDPIWKVEVNFDSSIDNCAKLYNYIKLKYKVEAEKIITHLKKITVSDLDITYEALGNVTNSKITDSLFAGSLGQFQAYVMNIAAISPIRKAIRNSSGGSSVVSGQSMANDITRRLTKAKMQAEGAGQFKWVAEILPMGFHFFLGIIYSCIVFVFIVSIPLGYEKGLGLIGNYFQGLIAFEFIKVAMVMASNAVNQYSEQNAAAAVAALGSNSATMDNIPFQLDYIATMSGVAGLLGVASIFIIPGIIFTGKVAAAASSLSSLGSKYLGNDIETSIGAVSKQKATENAFNNSVKDSYTLKKMGYDVDTPENMGSASYYSQLQQDIDSSNKGFAATMTGSENLKSGGDATRNMSNVIYRSI